MNKTLGFANVHTTLEDGSVLQVMFLHKHFAFVDMGEGKISFIPLSVQDETDLLEHNLNLYGEITDVDVIHALDEMLDGMTSEEELKRIQN